jgi:hypothetical protein
VEVQRFDDGGHVESLPPSRVGSVPAAAWGLDAHDIAGDEILRCLRRQRLAVQEVAPGSARFAALGSAWRVASALGDHGEPAGLEGSELAHDAVASVMAATAARADPERMPLDAERIPELYGLGRSSQCV